MERAHLLQVLLRDFGPLVQELIEVLLRPLPSLGPLVLVRFRSNALAHLVRRTREEGSCLAATCNRLLSAASPQVSWAGLQV